MLLRDQFDTWLNERETAIIDGALATELEVRGYDLNHPLWSAKVLKENPDSIREVHRDYFLAGADIAITASYQATPQGLQEFFGITSDEAIALIKKSVHVAQEALQEANRKGVALDRPLLVAGSIGPFGAYLADGSEYRGDYVRTIEEFQAFHRPRIQALVDADVDLLALETMPNLVEIEAIMKLLNDEFPKAIAWLSCTSQDADHLSDGTPWKAVVDAVDRVCGQVIAIGVNCVPMKAVTDTLKSIGSHTRLPLLCYPNSGETWNAENKTWQGVRPDDISHHIDHVGSGRPIHGQDASIPQSLAAGLDLARTGAKLIGGCCRTGPAFIQALKDSVHPSRRPEALKADRDSSPKPSTYIESSSVYLR